ncbi:MAG: hypothetical protein FJZ01_25815 [Candidatus Sericytochromatia bacterium]|nr:hypothetical protein [Candidatus Tanganyikabacteria bacterium]
MRESSVSKSLTTSALLSTSTGLFAANDIETFASPDATYGPSGAYIKNIMDFQLDLSDWVAEFKSTALPPNCYIRDERDGRLSIRPYFMAEAPNGRIARATSIQQGSDPEPITAVVVISEQEQNGPVNFAPIWFQSAPGMDPGIAAAFDGRRDTYCRQARDSGAKVAEGATFAAGDTTLTVSDGSKFQQNQTIAIGMERLKISSIAGNNLTVTRGEDGTTDSAHIDGLPIYIVDPRDRGVMRFKIPGAKPLQSFPFIEAVRIYGFGFVTLALEQISGGSLVDFFIPEATYKPLLGYDTPFSVPGDIINRAAAGITEEDEWYLRIELYADNSRGNPAATAASIAEIEILTRTIFGWRAELSDDLPQEAPAGYQPADPTTQFGDVFLAVQPGSAGGTGTIALNFSRLWAPEAYLRRVTPKYDPSPESVRHRFKILRLPGISLHDCRKLAEGYLLEETYKATPFTVTAPLDDRIEIGDTISLDLPDGSSRLLFVEGISDGGAPDAEIATYLLTDRSTKNRQVA